MNTNENDSLFRSLSQLGIDLTDEQCKKIEEKINEKLTYTAKIGVMGKTGAGKSSLCNALLGRDACPINPVSACTRDIQEEFLKIGNNGLVLVDVPGVGESDERNKEYAELYNKLLPELDLILWTVKSDDRALVTDEIFYRNLIKQYAAEGKPVVFAVTQSDKLGTRKDWCSGTIAENVKSKIEAKRISITNTFGIDIDNVIAVSVFESYNLDLLVERIVELLPNEQVISLCKNVDIQHISDETKAAAIDAATYMVAEILEDNNIVPETNKFSQFVQKITDYAINGVGMLKPAATFAEEYRYYSNDIDRNVDKLIQNQCTKDAINGFVTGVGGLITLPVAIPVDMSTSWIIQARMSAAIAYLYGHDINEDSVRTFIMASLLGDSVKEILKDAGVKIGQNVTKNLIKKIPVKVLDKINKKIGFVLLTKGGSKGIIKLTKLVPVIGGFIGAGFNVVATRKIGKKAKELFKNIEFE